MAIRFESTGHCAITVSGSAGVVGRAVLGKGAPAKAVKSMSLMKKYFLEFMVMPECINGSELKIH